MPQIIQKTLLTTGKVHYIMEIMKTFKYDAIFYEAFEEEEQELRKHLLKGEKYYFTWKTIQESNHEHLLAPIVSIRTQSLLPSEWKTQIKGIITRSTGYDHISAYLEENDIDIPAAYLPDYAGRAVAEQALMLWSALLRKLPQQQDAVKTFTRDGLTGRELAGKTIAVAGVGRIGSQIVDIAKGLRMNVLGIDLNPDTSLEIEYVSIDIAVKQSDIFVCALPLTKITKGLLSYDLLKQLPANSIFINIARGEISPPEGLLKLLNEGIISGIGLDVYDAEKDLAAVLRGGKSLDDIESIANRNSVAAILALMNHPAVITTPHNAFNTEEAVKRKSFETAANFAQFIKTGTFISNVQI